MYILITVPLFTLATTNLTAVPIRTTTRSTTFQAQYTTGTISVISDRRTNDPLELIINFQPRQQTQFPFTNAPRTIRIDLRTGLGTITRDAYIANGNTVPAATIEICSDALSRAERDQLNTNGRRVYSLIGSGLGQVHSVATSNCYYDIHDLPIIRTYERHGNVMQGGQFEIELRNLIRTLRE